ncbi:MAG: twitching motility protein, partial [Terracidiphilus sp.]
MDPVSVTAPTSQAAAPVSTASIISAMLQAAPRTSDLIFSPGRAPQVELHGKLMQVKIAGVGMLGAEDTARIAADLIGRNTLAVEKLKNDGSCDISYSLPKVSRFRVNIFT